MTETDDRRRLSLAIDLSKQCPPSRTAFSVGAVIVDERGAEIARGFSRETPLFHAEESALSKLDPDDERLAGATLYSSLEPCTRRTSRPRSCTELIVAAGIRRVVVAWREPPVFVPDAHGVAALRAAGVTVVEFGDLAEQAAAANAHLLAAREERHEQRKDGA
ncbi:MAG TPA: dCMP deaminase [Streptosporangiaceae bacterium]|jgi:pyrimidine deaminase RibD-like protein